MRFSTKAAGSVASDLLSFVTSLTSNPFRMKCMYESNLDDVRTGMGNFPSAF